MVINTGNRDGLSLEQMLGLLPDVKVISTKHRQPIQHKPKKYRDGSRRRTRERAARTNALLVR